jgi:hypothetical protein
MALNGKCLLNYDQIMKPATYKFKIGHFASKPASTRLSTELPNPETAGKDKPLSSEGSKTAMVTPIRCAKRHQKRDERQEEVRASPAASGLPGRPPASRTAKRSHHWHMRRPPGSRKLTQT